MRTLVLGGIVIGLVALSGTAMAADQTTTAAPAAQATPAAQAAPAAPVTSVAQAAPATQTAAAATTEADLDRVVCKSESAPTGTRLGTRHSCHTQREWDRMQQEQQNHLTQMQIQRGVTGN